MRFRDVLKKNVHFLCMILLLLLFSILIISFTTFKDSSTPLLDKKVTKVDDSWTLYNSKGDIEKVFLPYHVIDTTHRSYRFKHAISPEWSGQTICFYTEDEVVHVFVNGVMTYEFGANTKRWFGHSSGNNLHFVDIPADVGAENGGSIFIVVEPTLNEMDINISGVTVGDRATLILSYLDQNLAKITVSVFIILIMVVMGMMGIVLFTAKDASRESAIAMVYFALFCAFIGTYFLAQLNIFSLIWGKAITFNDAGYVLLMATPLALCLYYLNSSLKEYESYFLILIVANALNIAVQALLQILNVRDFAEMLVISQLLLLLHVLCGCHVLLGEWRKTKNWIYLTELFMFFAFTAGILVDILRNMRGVSGDDGYFSRYGVLLYCLWIVTKHMILLGQTYSAALQKKANDLLREVVEQQHMMEKTEREKNDMYLQMVGTLTATIDAKDEYTKGHSMRVAQYSKRMAKLYGLNEKLQEEIYVSGLLHDIGKIGIPDQVINKEQDLDEQEYVELKFHPIIGAQILEHINAFPMALSVAKHHHERMDGSGYPDGLVGEGIPLEARLVSVADAYDAMTTTRAYRKAMAKQYAKDELLKGSGSQFDPVFVDIMIKMIDEEL